MAEYDPPYNTILAPIADDIAKMNRKLRTGAKDAAQIIGQTKDRILEILRCGLISTYPKSNFFTHEISNKALLVALQEANYNSTSKVLKHRRKHCLPPALKYTKCINASDIERNITDTSYDPDDKVKSYKQTQKRLSDDEVRQIIDKYRAGASTYELANEFGCHRSTISRALKKSGIEVSHKASEHEALVKHVLQMYKAFMRPVDIGKELGISESTVRRILHENNVRIRHSSEYKGKR